MRLLSLVPSAAQCGGIATVRDCTRIGFEELEGELLSQKDFAREKHHRLR